MKKKLHILVTLLSLCFFISPLISSEADKSSLETDKNSVELGYNISKYQNDFGIGLQMLSPYFIKSRVAIKIGANYQWLEHVKGTKTTWTGYQNYQFGVRTRSSVIGEKIFIYGEGGLMVLLPNSGFSSKKTLYGGYGLFGFEFKPYPYFSYFLELGGVGTGARADKLATEPFYSNGFLTNVGFRVDLY